MDQYSFAVILLAAGKSSRFGKSKLTTKIHGKPMLEHTLRTYLSRTSVVNHVIVVTGAYVNEIRPILKRYSVSEVYNPNYKDEKMSTSIRIGAKYLMSESKHIVGVFIHPGDIPFVPEEIVQKMKDKLDPSTPCIVVPRHNGKSGHPVLLHHKYLEALSELSDDREGLRGFISDLESVVIHVETEDENVVYDIDFPEDLPE